MGLLANQFGLKIVDDSNSSTSAETSTAGDDTPKTNSEPSISDEKPSQTIGTQEKDVGIPKDAPVGSIARIKSLYQGPEDSQGRAQWLDKYPEDVEEAAENEETDKEELKDVIKAVEDYVVHGVTTWKHLWAIFQPGAIVYSAQRGLPRALKFYSGTYTKDNCGESYQLRVEPIDWDGSRFGVGDDYISIYKYLGTRPIKDLSACPLSFHPEKEIIRTTLIKRGRKFEQLAGYHYKANCSHMEFKERTNTDYVFKANGRIIIDAQSLRKFNPQFASGVNELDKDHFVLEDSSKDMPQQKIDSTVYETETSRPKVRLTDEGCLICKTTVPGYSLSLKKWRPPGVGKTLTAESVAETMHIPLYMMSAGDLGIRPNEVETSLRDILEMVSKWNAILLLDECDVFLEARTSNDLERNKLVSIFLRTLEYYEGILFLTTNRISNMDAAFQSRIHVSMAYPDLTTASRRQIWQNFLTLSKQKSEIEEKDLDMLAQVNLNGRQIKNVLKTSFLLASRKKSPLKREHVEVVLAIEGRRPDGGFDVVG
ncbi:putative ATP-dependent zinc metalloprotease FtsH [Glarea lozoyensis 74030]|uniref:Putative ATP-dependent zinc metalloprotease FtsH n=1 Tax=Glarea lozoyensis (strain ATCC 74030 / MF5533) TaxID=1104152 RepID=H0EI63_GLAL7|nr:putative ATP-dependent zinc metalloprotease FtsH [Glarea lozoyensis 74030]